MAVTIEMALVGFADYGKIVVFSFNDSQPRHPFRSFRFDNQHSA